MVVYILNHSTENLRGELTRWVIEVNPGVFVGKISKTVRDLLWQKISEISNIDALMIYSFNNEQGFNIEMIGEPDRFCVDYDGLLLIGRKFFTS